MIEQQWPGGVQPTTAAPQALWSKKRCMLRCATPGASIAYKIIKNEEPEEWKLYVRPLYLAPGERVKAAATRIGYAQSETLNFDRKP
jgi:N-sulfoglucosamine sulfohydrolase